MYSAEHTVTVKIRVICRNIVEWESVRNISEVYFMYYIAQVHGCCVRLHATVKAMVWRNSSLVQKILILSVAVGNVVESFSCWCVHCTHHGTVSVLDATHC